MPLPAGRRHGSGFTLIEVIVAMSVLGIASAALFSLLSSSMFNLRKLEDIHHYQLASENVMNRILLMTRLPSTGTATGRVTNLNADWTASVTPWYPANLSDHPPTAVMKIDVNLSWKTRGGLRTFHLESIKPASISYESNDFTQAIEKSVGQ